jgi:hypothetical protein
VPIVEQEDRDAMSALNPPHIITLGDTLLPLNTVLLNGNGDPYDLALYTTRFEMEQEGGTAEITTTATGVTAHPTQAFTVDTSTDEIKCNGHGVKEGDQIVVANTGGALPAGLAAATRYFAIDVKPNTFRLADQPLGGKKDITGAGTGTHTFYVVGSVQMDFLAANVDTVGNYRAWFTLDSGAELKTLPEGDRWFAVKVVNKGN